MAPSFALFGRTFASYGVMCALGMLAALVTVLTLTRKYRENLLHVMVLFAVSCIGAAAGAIALHFIVSSSFEALRSGRYEIGFVYYGGLLGGLLFFALTAKLLHRDASPLSRVLLPAVPIAHAFGRVGCFLGGCCFGILLKNGTRLPVQLIESTYELFLFVLLLRYSSKNRPHLIRAYLLLYAPFRFVIEFFRGDEIRGFIGIFSTSQAISLAIIVCCLISMVKKGRSA